MYTVHNNAGTTSFTISGPHSLSYAKEMYPGGAHFKTKREAMVVRADSNKQDRAFVLTYSNALRVMRDLAPALNVEHADPAALYAVTGLVKASAFGEDEDMVMVIRFRKAYEARQQN